MDIPPVLADEDRLQQILQNLVSNAIKFSDKGTVSVSAREVNGELQITITMRDRYSKRNAGIHLPGFPAGDGSTTWQYEGTGTRTFHHPLPHRIARRKDLGGIGSRKGDYLLFTMPVSDEEPAAVKEDVKSKMHGNCFLPPSRMRAQPALQPGTRRATHPHPDRRRRTDQPARA